MKYLANSASFRSTNLTLACELETLVQSWSPPVAIPIDCEDLTRKRVARECAHWCRLAPGQCTPTSKEKEVFQAVLDGLSAWRCDSELCSHSLSDQSLADEIAKSADRDTANR